MIARFFLFEVRYWLRQPMVYIFLFINASFEYLKDFVVLK